LPAVDDLNKDLLLFNSPNTESKEGTLVCSKVFNQKIYMII